MLMQWIPVLVRLSIVHQNRTLERTVNCQALSSPVVPKQDSDRNPLEPDTVYGPTRPDGSLDCPVSVCD